MTLSDFCIKRPVFATVLSLVLIIFGIMGFQRLHTRFFPEFASNTIQIRVSYPGASASLVEHTVTTPIENALSGMEGIDTLTSISAQALTIVKIKVAPNENLYDLTNKIRNELSMINDELPRQASAPYVQMGHGEMDLIDIGFNIGNNKLDLLRDYLDRNVVNDFSQLPGVASVEIFGASSYVMDVEINPTAMFARHITTQEISQAIIANNLELPAGMIKTPNMEIPVTANTGLSNAAAFGDIELKNNDGKIVYLKDIATVSLIQNPNNQSIATINGKRGILLSVYNASNANPIAVSSEVKARLATMQPQFPDNIKAFVTFDQAKFMQNSISEVYKSIAFSVFLVSIIIYLFLGRLSSAMIPILTIPICIMATMGMMFVSGFSINIITLLALVLSIGLVVDDAIVVLENIHRHMEAGKSRLQAALIGSREITVPIIAMTLTLAAVYAPIGLIQAGGSSHIFASFAFTLASAVIISGFVALTLSPMMCSKVLKYDPENSNKIIQKIDQFFHRLAQQYKRFLNVVLSHRWKILGTTIVLVISTLLLVSLPKTYVPREDMGFVLTLKSHDAKNDEHQT